MINLLHRMNQFEIPICLFFNRINHRKLLSQFFSLISRLGDGIFWYSIMLLLPLIYGIEGVYAALHMAAVGGIGVFIYKWMKISTQRIRPYSFHNDIIKSVAALDKFSFPSGHTLHAVGFSVVLLAYYPEWSILVIPFAFLVAISRLVLGLHYPSDVLIGALIGIVLSVTSLFLI